MVNLNGLKTEFNIRKIGLYKLVVIFKQYIFKMATMTKNKILKNFCWENFYEKKNQSIAEFME